MIFRRISYALALQFTGFVFLLLLVTGAVFLAGDVAQRQRDAEERLRGQLVELLQRPAGVRGVPSIPPFQRQRIRITDSLGKVLYAGALFENVPFKWDRRLRTIDIDGEKFDVLTAPFVENGAIVGYLQVADRSPLDDLRARVLLFLLVSAGISALTFGVGLFFARRNLKPAEQMMQRLEQFTQDASHELRTPLTAISTSLDLAMAAPQDCTKELQSAKRGVKDVTTLVERLLQLARLDSFVVQKENTDLSSLVDGVLDAHEATAKERGITLERAVAPGVRTQCDAALTRQVVTNLVSNALKFTPKGGRVSVTLTKDTLVVRDNGQGISPEALPKIFDRFYREDAARSNQADGLGLGLALTKRIVDLHGWTINVESIQGKRTVFLVKF